MQKLGYTIDTEAMKYIELTDKWYTNTESDFHTAYTINNEEYDLERTNFAKRLCADDANLIEVVEVNASKNDDDNKIINDILKANRFEKMYRKQIEEMSANGTVGAYIRIENADIYKDGSYRGGNIKIEYCNTLNIVPLSVVNDEITEVAFTGHYVEDTNDIYTIVLFELQDDTYIATSVYLDKYGKEIEKKKQVVKLGNVKPFAIMRTAEVNNLKMTGYGFPKLWGAIPNLKILDLTMTMWKRDLEKSDKIILINDKLCKMVDGKPVPPNKQMKNVFVQVGADKLPQQDTLYQEYNPTVRIDNVKNSLETALSLLSMNYGFGTKKYSFENGRIVTATEYVGERQDAMQEINKQRAESVEYITGIVKAIAYFYEQTQDTKLNVDEVMVDFDDSYIEDRSAVAESMRNDALSFGIPELQVWYFMKKYNLSEDEAKKLINQMPSNDEGDEGDE